MTRIQKILTISFFTVLLLLGSVGLVVLRYKNFEPDGDGQAKDSATTKAVNDSDVVGETSDLIDTSDWKTYRNEEFRFEIRYPPELIGKEIIHEGQSSYNENYWVADIHFNLPTTNQVVPPYYSFRGTSPGVRCDREPSQITKTQRQVTIINGTEFIKTEIRHTEDKRIFSIRYEGTRGDICYTLIYNQANGMVENVMRFEQIVSTFTLLNSDQVD